ncbi:MAG TPA: MFS transporter [Acidimicrobiales bacterium]|nr:MFS transporter [Acidimicrobiales bacterium]
MTALTDAEATPARRRRRRSPSTTAPDEVVDVDAARERLRATARDALGVHQAGDPAPLREAMAKSSIGWYPLAALSLLVIIDEFQSYAFLVLGPEISDSLGISRSSLGAIVAFKTLAIMVAALPMAALVQRRARRAVLSVATAFAWSVATLGSGFVRSGSALTGVLVADGASTGSVRALHPPLLLDSYPPEARIRVLSFYRGADSVGNILAPLLVAALTALLGFTWRGVFVVMGVVSVAASVFAVRLRDPGYGRWDVEKVRDRVREATDGATSTIDGDDVRLGFFEIVRRLFLIPTVRRMLAVYATMGMLIVPLYTYLFFYLDDRWGVGPGGRGIFFAASAAGSLVSLSLFARRGEADFRRDPKVFVRRGAMFLQAGVIAMAVATLMPSFALVVLLFCVSGALLALMVPVLHAAMLSVVRPTMRPHAAALAGIFLSAVGGFGGLLLLDGFDRRFGAGTAIAVLAVPGLVAAAVLRSSASVIDGDFDRLLDEIVEEEQLSTLRARGVQLPMLSCRNLDVAYGRLQVLFGVDFTVDDGEMVALLGTNGAGKSTLLRAVSGLNIPNRGSVRYRGADITYLDAERRVRLGILQVPGGKAVFAPLTVVENLRAFGNAHGRKARSVEADLDIAFEAFPALASKRDQRASTLSGGEQQMLGLAKAFIAQPRLLLIDELSLGLAPKVVGELLAMVRTINGRGTAVVLVEQSVNIALSLVDHAYFMEKGQVRFDGKSSDLLERADLLRSVFLGGAAGAFAGGTAGIVGHAEEKAAPR